MSNFKNFKKCFLIFFKNVIFSKVKSVFEKHYQSNINVIIPCQTCQPVREGRMNVIKDLMITYVHALACTQKQ